LAAAALSLGACGGDDSGSGGDKKSGPRYPYPAGTVRTFVNSCAASAKGQRDVCQCTIDRLQETLPFDEFSTADKAIRADKPISPETRARIDDATENCRD